MFLKITTVNNNSILLFFDIKVIKNKIKNFLNKNNKTKFLFKNKIILCLNILKPMFII
jgi:hypothetical protein